MAQVSIWKPTDQPWTRTRGGSLKITASPSVTPLPFRSHMLLKKQQRLTERIHKIFSQPFPGFVRPMTGLFLDREWPQQCTMSWESEPPLQNNILQLCPDAHTACFSYMLTPVGEKWIKSQANVIYIHQKGAHTDTIPPLKCETASDGIYEAQN